MSGSVGPSPDSRQPLTSRGAPPGQVCGAPRLRRRVLRGVGLLVVAIVGIWCLLAWRAGSFIGDRHMVAATLDDPGIEAFSQRKRYIDVDGTQVAYIDEGGGEPLILLHGCPFHAYEWRDVIPILSAEYRVIAPDLLGLGDTQVRLDDDYRLPGDVDMVVGLMDSLGFADASFVSHDHGAATLQLMMRDHPERIRRAVITNAEAYDQWPSEPERPYLEIVIHPLLNPLFRFALQFTPIQQEVFSIAVHRKEAFTDDVVAAYVRPHISTPARWQRFVRFFRWQLDPDNNMETMRAVEGLTRFERPTLILWGKQDTNFGPAIAERLAADIPGSVGIVWMEHSAHMPMQEEPEAYGDAVLRFLAGRLDAGVDTAATPTNHRDPS
ncbi:MAG: alpha/beta fold hydrolase [Candidatus Krumholzibacteriia bacterium]